MSRRGLDFVGSQRPCTVTQLCRREDAHVFCEGSGERVDSTRVPTSTVQRETYLADVGGNIIPGATKRFVFIIVKPTYQFGGGDSSGGSGIALDGGTVMSGRGGVRDSATEVPSSGASCGVRASNGGGVTMQCLKRHEV